MNRTRTIVLAYRGKPACSRALGGMGASLEQLASAASRQPTAAGARTRPSITRPAACRAAALGVNARVSPYDAEAAPSSSSASWSSSSSSSPPSPPTPSSASSSEAPSASAPSPWPWPGGGGPCAWSARERSTSSSERSSACGSPSAERAAPSAPLAPPVAAERSRRPAPKIDAMADCATRPAAAAARWEGEAIALCAVLGRDGAPRSVHMHLLRMKRTTSSCSRYSGDSGRRDAIIIVRTTRWNSAGKRW
mmetsp:Transcript_2173/g.5562  ORF Transcript_2173/g.5562 Transcript_2173/m.5562 type:complete len:251 (+) Transcript_2173:1588-2340(+)